MVSAERNIPAKNVCVIGAGPSGLVAARELRKEGHNVVVLEQNHDIGGQWLYEPNVDVEGTLNNENNVHSSIYESLRLTSPREIMGFSDFPFLVKKNRDMRRFPGHKELFLYLKDFCEWFGLRDMIRFNTKVEYVGMLLTDDYNNYDEHYGFGRDLKWIVKSKDLKDYTFDEKKKQKKIIMAEEVFDAVVIATGHYSQPRLPTIKGMSKAINSTTQPSPPHHRCMHVSISVHMFLSLFHIICHFIKF